MKQQKHIYNKRMGRVADFHGTTTQNRVCVHYPNLIRANGQPVYGQVLIGRNNVWISDDQYRVIRLAEQKRQKIWLILTIVTTVLLVVAIVLMVFTSLNNPLIGIIAFALFIASFMLYMYSRQNIAVLKELLKD